MSKDTKKIGTCYLEVRPGRYYNELRIVKATSKKPRVTTEGSVLVKLAISIPGAAFEPLAPSVVVDVPAEMLVTGEDVHLQAVPE